MFLHVLGSVHYHKVLRAVVALVAVKVVDDLIWPKRSSDHSLCDEAVLRVVPRCWVASHSTILVATTVDAPTLPVGVGSALQPLSHRGLGALRRVVGCVLPASSQSSRRRRLVRNS